MSTSSLVFEEGAAIDLGSHGDHSFLYEEGTAVPDTGVSTKVFEDGVGLGGGVIIDSFEDGDMAEYVADYVQGSFNASVINDPNVATDGDHYLKSANGGRGGARYSTSGLTTYPGAGDTYEWDFQHTGSNPQLGSSGTLFGVSGENTLYTALICFVGGSQSGPNNPGVYLGKDNYLNSSLGGTTYDFAANGHTNKWLTGRLEWGANGSITLTVLDGSTELASVTGSDSSYTSGGFGWHTDNTENDTNFDAYFDRAVIA